MPAPAPNRWLSFLPENWLAVLERRRDDLVSQASLPAVLARPSLARLLGVTRGVVQLLAMAKCEKVGL